MVVDGLDVLYRMSIDTSRVQGGRCVFCWGVLFLALVGPKWPYFFRQAALWEINRYAPDPTPVRRPPP